MARQVIIFVTNHTPTKEVVDNYDVITVSFQGWATIPGTGVREYVRPLVDECQELLKAHPDAFVAITGEPRATRHVVNQLPKGSCVAPFSERVSIDEPQEDGSILKKSIFKFKGFVPYDEE